MSNRPSFVERCLAGEVATNEIDDFIDAWHADPDGGELHDYLGMTGDEYSLWLRVPDALSCILKARRDREPLTRVIRTAYEAMRLGPPGSDSPTAARLRTWLKENGVLI
jgi:hypothetical protein